MSDNMSKEQGTAESPMAFNNGQKTCKMCGHGRWGCCHRFFWLRLVLGLIILAAVFCIGVKIGEFKGEFGRDFDRFGGRQMMRYYPQRAYQLGQPWGMMQTSGATVPQSNTATSTPKK